MTENICKLVFSDDGIKDSSVKDIKKCVDYMLDIGDQSLIEKIIYQKHFRPGSVEDQYAVLEYISGKSCLPLNVKLNAVIASAHKALESLNAENVKDTLNVMDSCFLDIDKLELDERYIRKDRFHIFFSYCSVYSHLCLFLKDYRRLFVCSEKSFKFVEEFDFSLAKEAFFLTCTNVARCLSFYIISRFIDLDFLRNDYNITSIVASCRVLLKTSMAAGLANSDINHVKHIEFKRDYKILEAVCKLENDCRRRETSQVIESLERLYKYALRPEGEEKVKYLHNVFLESIKPIVSENLLAGREFYGKVNALPRKNIVVVDDKFGINNPDILRELALSFENSGDVETALRVMQKALELRPSGPFIKKKVDEYTQLLQEKGNQP